jgi:uncharacterized protein with HEPN domain
MRTEDQIRVQHMIDAAESVAQFLDGRQRRELDSDRMLLFAVVRAIEIIGEAAGRVSLETRDATPEIPWGAIIAVRNRLIHGYFDIDTQIVWKTVSKELPALLRQLRKIETGL